MTTLQRAMLIFNRLRQSPTSKQTLLELLRRETGETYTKLEAKAEERKFERDVEKLRKRLGATVVYDGERQVYVLRDAGALLGVTLSADSLRALAFLLETTNDNPETRTILQPLLDTISSSMPAAQLRQLERASAELRVDLRRLDAGEISADVWEKVRFARDKKRCLRFYYRSPAQPNHEGILHIVEPHELLFERGHFYLNGYCIESRDADGVRDGEKWLRYRLDRILGDEVEVTPNSVKGRTKPRFAIKFKVAPQLWRGGLSRRFEKMEVIGEEGDWWVISAETESLFYARRVLLGYGALVVALEPESLVQQMHAVIAKMSVAYQIEQNKAVD